MIITLTPDDIIKRCLWKSYRRFALRGLPESEIEEIVKENKPISLEEDMAYVIGLLKVIETDNLVHRFDSHILDNILRIKSTIQEDNVVISVRVIEMEFDNFIKRFPDYWEPGENFQKGLEDLEVYVSALKEKLVDIPIYEYKVKYRMVKYYLSKDIKKLIEKKN